MLDTSFQQLAANPFKGKDCSDIREGYWKLNVGSHIIFYRKALPDTIEIVRFLNERMDIDTQLSTS
jgi:toxin ParE1/3/4